MRFYVVFAGTCICSEITQKHIFLNTIWYNIHHIFIRFMCFYVVLLVSVCGANASVFTWYLQALAFYKKSYKNIYIHTQYYNIFMIIRYYLLQFVMFGWLAGWVPCSGLPVLVSRLLGCWRLGRPAQGNVSGA